MFFSRLSLATIALSALSAQAVYIYPLNATTLSTCQTYTLNFKGLAPFTVSVWPSCSEDADADQPYASYDTNSTTVYWKVNEAAGKSVMFEIEDAHGNTDYTDEYDITAGSDASCVGVRPSFSGPANSTSGSTPTTQTGATTAPGNVGGGLYPSTTYSDTAATSATAVVGGAIGGAVSNFSPRVEMAALIVLGSSVASLLF